MKQQNLLKMANHFELTFRRHKTKMKRNQFKLIYVCLRIALLKLNKAFLSQRYLEA